MAGVSLEIPVSEWLTLERSEAVQLHDKNILTRIILIRQYPSQLMLTLSSTICLYLV